jgi:glycosyltransferase involved in cell wall biosynthesis
MHVLLVNNIYPPIVAGGAELIVSYLAEGLVERGHQVTVVSTCGPEMEPYPTEMRNGVEVVRFFPPNVYWSFARDRNPGLNKLLWHARDAWNRRAGQMFGDILQRTRPDVVHTHVIDGLSASIWGEASGQDIPVIHTAHDYHLICPRAFMLSGDWKLCTRPSAKCRLYRGWHLSTTRYVDLFTSPSRFLIAEHARAGMRLGATAVVSNGIPQPAEADAVKQSRPPDARRRFLMLSRLTVDKGVEVVLEAAKRLPDGADVEIVIAGKGPLEDRVKAAAAQDRRITYLGFVTGEQKIEALANAGYLLLPSLWYENAPVAIVEAASYGLGVIGSNLGAIPEFVEDGATGVLFPPGDAASLAELMLVLAAAKNPLPELGHRSEAIARQFTVDRMVDTYETHYRKLMRIPQPLALAG